MNPITKQHLLIARHVAEHPDITYKEIATFFGVSRDTVSGVNETSEQELRLCRMEFVDGELRSLLYGQIRHNADQLAHGI